MKSPYTKLLCAFFVSAFFFAACKTYDNDSNVVRQMPNENQNAKIKDIGENQSQAKDDAEELGKLIKIPYETEEALWKIENAAKIPNANHGETAPKLIAVLKFKSADAQKIVEQAANYKPATETSISVENWFPPELVAKSQESGDETIKGTVYAPNDFAQSPYSNGTLTRIAETDYFVLELFSM
ncbi:MAG: hypothetical protein ACR2F2_10810 [Pyrinomonadaceae bacterium]